MTAVSWKPRSPDAPPSDDVLENLAGQLCISPFLAQLLWQRGFTGAQEMSYFLSPNLRHLAPPSSLPGIPEAAEILVKCVADTGRLLVWGDYDVDGITSTALVKDFFARHGVKVRHHIPSRLEHGYGLHIPAIEQIAAEGVTHILTADCGISDTAPIARARELGIIVVVSDHHLPGDSLPDANAICNPRMGDCPCPDLAGVGVVFLLMAAVNALLEKHGSSRVDMRDFLDLVALGTLADVVNLTGQNRILVKNGLLCISAPSRPGIVALKRVCKHDPSAALEAGQIVYMLAPRINAAGRLGQSDIALNLLLTRDRADADVLAASLDKLNTERREEEKRIQAEAMEQAHIQAAQGKMGLVLHAPHWHPGIIGIVASRVAETLNRPTLVLCDDRHAIKGSGRSVPDFDLHAALTCCADLFLGFGGHRQAAGVTLHPARLPDLARRFNDIAMDMIGASPAQPMIYVDGDLPFSQAAEFTFLKELEMLHPFGPGNPEPVFASPPVLVKSISSRPGGMTLMKFADTDHGVTLQAKSWQEKTSMPQTAIGKHVHLAYTPRIDRYNGAASVEIKLRDWKEAE